MSQAYNNSLRAQSQQHVWDLWGLEAKMKKCSLHLPNLLKLGRKYEEFCRLSDIYSGALDHYTDKCEIS